MLRDKRELPLQLMHDDTLGCVRENVDQCVRRQAQKGTEKDEQD